jgi:hypothetical protein
MIEVLIYFLNILCLFFEAKVFAKLMQLISSKGFELFIDLEHLYIRNSN